MVEASVSLGHPTYAFVRPTKPNHDPSKKELLDEFESMGVTIFWGELDEHDKLVEVLRQVDVVISTLAVPQYLEQLEIIRAMKEAGNIKRFFPSEFGNEVDRIISALSPFQACCDKKKLVRRAAEESGVPYTFVSANSCGAYFINYLLHPCDEEFNKVTIYGTGDAKFVCNYEKDIAGYTVKAATDPRAENRLIIYRPPKNIITQLDLISTWEKKTGRTLERTYIPEEDIIKLSQTLPFPDNVPMAILHNIFIKGEQMNYELRADDLEATELYPDYKYITFDELLDIFLIDPPKARLSVFG